MAEIVETHAGYTYAQRPRAFHWQGERWEVETVLAQARRPEGRWFRVRTADARAFELIYHEAEDAWRIWPAREGAGSVEEKPGQDGGEIVE